MHGAIWKLSALATVIGFGLLAVVLQQRGLGKGTGKAAAVTDGAPEGSPTGGDENGVPTPPAPGGESGNEDPGLRQQGDAPPIEATRKPAAPKSSDDSEVIALSEDEDDAEFSSKKSTPRTSPRASQAQTGRRSQSQSEADTATSRPTEYIDATGNGGQEAQPPEVIDAFDTANPTARTDRGRSPSGQSSRQAGEFGEDGDREGLAPRPRSPGRPRSGNGDPLGADDEVVAQAPNARKSSANEFEADPPEPIKTAPRTGAGLATVPRARNSRNPHSKLIQENDEPDEIVAPMAAQVVEEVAGNHRSPNTPQSPFDGQDNSNPKSSARPSRVNAALQDRDDDGLPRGPRGGATRPTENSESPVTTSNTPSSDEEFGNQSVRESSPKKRNLPPIESDPDANPAEELSTTPPVPGVRKRPSIDGDDGSDDQPKTAPRTGTRQRASDPNAPYPIPKVDQQSNGDRDQRGNESPVGIVSPRGNRQRPNPLSDEEDGTADQPPATFPVGKQRQQNDSNADDELNSTRGRGNSQSGSDSANAQDTKFGGSKIEDYNPVTGKRGPSRHVINIPPSNPSRVDVEQSDAAASNSSATDVIAPRSPVIPAPTPEAIRQGRARVTIEKLAPATASLGQPLIYNIVIRNNGNAIARHVVVEDDVPEGVTMQGSIPQAEMTGRKLKWKIGNLAVGAEQKISVKVIPTVEGPVGSAATVNFVHDSRPIPADGEVGTDQRVTMEVQFTRQVNVGEMFEVRFRLANRTSERLSKLAILIELPPGLQHERRQKILQYDIETLGPNEVRDLPYPLLLTASQAGNSITRAFLMQTDPTGQTDGTALDKRDFTIDVNADSRGN